MKRNCLKSTERTVLADGMQIGIRIRSFCCLNCNSIMIVMIVVRRPVLDIGWKDRWDGAGPVCEPSVNLERALYQEGSTTMDRFHKNQ